MWTCKDLNDIACDKKKHDSTWLHGIIKQLGSPSVGQSPSTSQSLSAGQSPGEVRWCLRWCLLPPYLLSLIFFSSLPLIRSMDQTSINSDQAAFSRLTQEQPTHLSVHPQSQATPSSTSQSSPRYLSDSAALSYQQWDRREQDKHREHPLTRLEIALTEVQRCASPDDGIISSNSHGNNSFGDDSQVPVRSLSVLEKVSRFERRERTGKQRSHSTSHVHNKSTQLRVSQIKPKKNSQYRNASVWTVFLLHFLICLILYILPKFGNLAPSWACCDITSLICVFWYWIDGWERPQHPLWSRWLEKHAGEKHQWDQSPQNNELQRS